MTQTISAIKRTSILSLNETNQFVKEIDLACIEVDFKKLKDTFIKAKLLNHLETNDFLMQGERSFKRFNNPAEGIELLEAKDRATKCSGCTLGKTVRAYDIRYRKQESIISVEYNSSFAVNLEIIDGELVEFGWCNFFLNKEEYKEIFG
jgi:hypothetical protein